MVQLYALSVFCNILSGLLVASRAGERTGFFAQLRRLLEENNLRFGLGIASILIAFLKLLSPMEGDIPIVGDLLPVIAGLAAGGILLFDFFRSSSQLNSPTVDRVEKGITAYRKYIGPGATAVGVLHFLMPMVPVL